MLVEYRITIGITGHSPVFKLLAGSLVCCVCWVSLSHKVHPETNSSHDSLGTGHTSKIRKISKRKNCPVYLCGHHFICPKTVWFLWVQTRWDERGHCFSLSIQPSLSESSSQHYCYAGKGKTWRKHEFKNYSDISETSWQYLWQNLDNNFPLPYYSIIPL